MASTACLHCGATEGQYHHSRCIFQGAIGSKGEHAKSVDPRSVMPASPASYIQLAIPPEVAPYTHEIRRFVEAMIYKLAKHSNKGKWEGKDASSQIPLLHGEIKELVEAMDRGNMVEILLEAADVANYALIISAIVMERGK